ncbi:CoA transferase [Dactylosporangium sp. CA-052675]|uniref:CoA transferase n=1 Tax=Dactylosporangium sp. CA-052675 TaxID=3239927 RepID=UPI003D911ED8
MTRERSVAARESIVLVPDADLGAIPMQNVAPRLSATPGRIRWTGPALGEHDEEVRASLHR